MGSILVNSLATLFTLLLGICLFLSARYIVLKAHQHTAKDQALSGASLTASGSKKSQASAVPPAHYVTYVFGSGGHSSEMLALIRQTFSGSPRQHRRYIIGEDDKPSVKRVEELENRLEQAGKFGTWDSFVVPRARRVHQSWLTTPWTCLVSALKVYTALTVRTSRQGESELKYAHVIVTNGPALGFIIGVVSFGLRLLGLVPQERLKVVYIETFAHISSLSLTGKLFHKSGIADLFLVHHRQLANKLEVVFAGDVGINLVPAR